MANCLQSVLLSYNSPPRLWTPTDIDSILEQGDHLYMCLTKKYSSLYLSIDDIPLSVASVSGTLYGTLGGETNHPFYSLHDAIYCLMNNHVMIGCTLVFGNSEPGYCVAILKNDDSFFLFDSHSRNGDGLVDCNGCSMFNFT